MQPSSSRPLRVAVIGAGPAGFYATSTLLKSGEQVSVDIFERLPSPHGLVRFGVAPDHDTVKSKAFTFDQILRDERVRYFGNVTLGRDLSHAELKTHFDAVIYTVGASSDKSLGIPGEDLPGSLSATEFVAWYNAHPYHTDLNPQISREVAVIGMGNVALDVTRALLKNPDELAKTDMAAYAVEAFRQAAVTDIHILGRRGPSQANFTPKELREVAELPEVDILVDPEAIKRNQVGTFEDALEAKKAARNLELFTDFSKRIPSGKKRVHIHFFVSPVEILGIQQVEGVKLEKNRLEPKGDRLSAVGTGEFEHLNVGLLLRSVGYRSEPLASVPFDDKRGVIPNDGGRVTEQGEVVPGEYTSGWVRRGASGVIGTNKLDAEETVGHLLADLAQLPTAQTGAPESVTNLLQQRQIRFVDKHGWFAIARAERRNGGREHRRALKFSDIGAMLGAANV